MGISLVPGLFLARNARHVGNAQRGIIMGRQKLHMNGRKLDRFLRASQQYGFALSEVDVVQGDGFTETLFTALGYPTIEAMDFTDKEAAQHIHDLNRPVPEALREQFDIVIDGGTTEHIFYIGQAIDNCWRLLKPGGLFLGFVAADGWFGHGFFQTGPDVPWRYWHHMRGCEMLEVSITPRKDPRTTVPIPDPTGHRRGGERFLKGPHMLMTACRKPLIAPAAHAPMQGHYL